MELSLLAVLSLCPQEHKEQVDTDLDVTTKTQRDTSWVCAAGPLGLQSSLEVKGMQDSSFPVYCTVSLFSLFQLLIGRWFLGQQGGSVGTGTCCQS